MVGQTRDVGMDLGGVSIELLVDIRAFLPPTHISCWLVSIPYAINPTRNNFVLRMLKYPTQPNTAPRAYLWQLGSALKGPRDNRIISTHDDGV